MYREGTRVNLSTMRQLKWEQNWLWCTQALLPENLAPSLKSEQEATQMWKITCQQMHQRNHALLNLNHKHEKVMTYYKLSKPPLPTKLHPRMCYAQN